LCVIKKEANFIFKELGAMDALASAKDYVAETLGFQQKNELDVGT
jgi:hypothetical protein